MFVVASILESRYPWLGYVRATAEAAMVGAIADWFAVTALFRYPLGIPIPHTAIIPSRKDRIGRSLGNFVQNNFLSPPVIVARLRRPTWRRSWRSGWPTRTTATRWASTPPRASAAWSRCCGTRRCRRSSRRSVISRVRATQVAPLMGNVLSLVTADNRHQELLDSAIRLFGRLFDENREALRGEDPPRDALVDAQRGGRPDLQEDRAQRGEDAGRGEQRPRPSAARAASTRRVGEFVERLQSSPEMIERGEELKEEVLRHPAVREYSGSLWADVKGSVLKHSADPQSEFRRPRGARRRPASARRCGRTRSCWTR